MRGSERFASFAGSTMAHVAVAALAMGGWATFANQGHGVTHQLQAGLVQGVLSGAITFGLKRSLELMAERLPGLAALVAPPLASCLVVLAVLVGAHSLAGTPEIFRTIAVPYTVSSTYAWIYSLSLYRSRRKATA